MRNVSRALAAALPPLCLLFPALRAEESAPPFPPGETFRYQLCWNGLKVGQAEFIFHEEPVDINGVPARHLSFKVWTSGWINFFYRVENEIHSYVAPDFSRSLLFTKNQTEGRHKRDIVLTFDWEEKTARYTNFGKSREPIAVEAGTHDPLSVVFAARLLPMPEGGVLKVPLTDGKKFQRADIRVLEKEKIEVEAGEYNALKVRPELRLLGGVFNKEKDAPIYVWFSEDERKIPLKMKSKVTFGHFRGELVSAGITAREDEAAEGQDKPGCPAPEFRPPRQRRHHRK